MSTKATIVYGKNFHFYNECLDDQHVYLELEGTHFEAGYNRVMVPIPIHIWEAIRHEGGPDLSLTNATDEELDEIAARRVDELIKSYEDAKTKGWRALFVDAELPRDEQISKTLEDLKARQKQQQEISIAIEQIRAENPRTKA